jgi:hypothetical protein
VRFLELFFARFVRFVRLPPDCEFDKAAIVFDPKDLTGATGLTDLTGVTGVIALAGSTRAFDATFALGPRAFIVALFVFTRVLLTPRAGVLELVALILVLFAATDTFVGGNVVVKPNALLNPLNRSILYIYPISFYIF